MIRERLHEVPYKIFASLFPVIVYTILYLWSELPKVSWIIDVQDFIIELVLGIIIVAIIVSGIEVLLHDSFIKEHRHWLKRK